MVTGEPFLVGWLLAGMTDQQLFDLRSELMAIREPTVREQARLAADVVFAVTEDRRRCLEEARR